MSCDKKIILIGYFIESVELCEDCGYSIVGYVDNERNDSKYVYLGNDEQMLSLAHKYKDIPLFLVPDDPDTREKIYKKYHGAGFVFETVVSKYASVSRTACIGEGTMIQAGCNVSSNTRIGRCVRLNSCSNCMHDVDIDDFCVVAPSAVLLGGANVLNKSYIGANATVLPHITIDGACIGAGAVVTKDCKNEIMIGVPARKRC